MKRIINGLIIAGAIGLYLSWGWLMRQTCGLMVATEHPTQASCLVSLPPVSSHIPGQVIGAAFLAGEAISIAWLIKRWRFRTPKGKS